MPLLLCHATVSVWYILANGDLWYILASGDLFLDRWVMAECLVRWPLLWVLTGVLENQGGQEIGETTLWQLVKQSPHYTHTHERER